MRLTAPFRNESSDCFRFFRDPERTTVQQWQQARRLAGLPPLDDELVASRKPFMSQFYQWKWDYACFEKESCSDQNPAFMYTRVWKSANNFLYYNLVDLCNFGNPLDVQEWGVRKPCYQAYTAANRFTFVRDPLDHFLSGYTESTYRTYQRCKHHGLVEQAPSHAMHSRAPNFSQCALQQNDPELAREFIMALLDADGDRVKSRRHMITGTPHIFVQAASLPTWRPTFIGHLETFEQDWNKLAKLLSLPRFDRLDSTLGKHTRTSADQYGRRAAMVELLEAEPNLEEALVHLLDIDYKCFGYNRSHRAPRKWSTTRPLAPPPLSPPLPPLPLAPPLPSPPLAPPPTPSPVVPPLPFSPVAYSPLPSPSVKSRPSLPLVDDTSWTPSGRNTHHPADTASSTAADNVTGRPGFERAATKPPVLVVVTFPLLPVLLYICALSVAICSFSISLVYFHYLARNKAQRVAIDGGHQRVKVDEKKKKRPWQQSGVVRTNACMEEYAALTFSHEDLD